MNFAFGMPGPTELILILAIVLIFFGVGKLPAVLAQMGKGVKAFKDGMKDDDEISAKEIDVTPPRPKASEAEEVRTRSNG